jgi:hypothetical protein
MCRKILSNESCAGKYCLTKQVQENNHKAKAEQKTNTKHTQLTAHGLRHALLWWHSLYSGMKNCNQFLYSHSTLETTFNVKCLFVSNNV